MPTASFKPLQNGGYTYHITQEDGFLTSVVVEEHGKVIATTDQPGHPVTICDITLHIGHPLHAVGTNHNGLREALFAILAQAA